MASKKLINEVSKCVDECLEGFVAVNSGVQILDGHRVVIRSDVKELKEKGVVTLISGGGSGHEPSHAGFVGDGMLSGAVAGAVFTSPPPNSILAAIRQVGHGNSAGTLVIIKNYTGDRLNFGMAAERAAAEGLKVEMVVVGDDCALSSFDKTAGRRGLCGTIFIHKIAGALAANGKSLNDIASFCREAITDMGTIGLSLSPCSVPGTAPSFMLGADEMELGLGIHGEAGVKRTKMLPVKEAVDEMLKHMTNEFSSTHLKINQGDNVALIINNLGGTSVLELNIVAKEAILWLEKNGICVVRAYCGSFMTAMEMAGISLSVMKVNNERLLCLDFPTRAPGWNTPYLSNSVRVTPSVMSPIESLSQKTDVSGAQLSASGAKVLHKAISYGSEAVGNCEVQLNTLDRVSGDGDCGSTLKRGTDAMRNALGIESDPGLPINCPKQLFLSISNILENDMGGSSGAVYSIFFTSAAKELTNSLEPEAWCNALQSGIQAIKKYGGADTGDRTMIDALEPACNAVRGQLKAGNTDIVDLLKSAAEAAEMGAANTVSMVARAGRASYVATENLTQPDPGAHSVGVWMRAVYQGVRLVL